MTTEVIGLKCSINGNIPTIKAGKHTQNALMCQLRSRQRQISKTIGSYFRRIDADWQILCESDPTAMFDNDPVAAAAQYGLLDAASFENGFTEGRSCHL